MQTLELPKEIQSKIPKTLALYVRNPRHPSLKIEKIKVGNEAAFRMRIDETYRMHVEPWDAKRSRLIVRAIGGHWLEGIGHD